MTSNQSAPSDTILFIHGLWMTARSWEKWVERYESRGYRVLAPSWPGLETEVEALNADSTPLKQLNVDKIVDHYDGIIRGLDSPPIIMGHSLGGTIVQLLLARGLPAAGVGVAPGTVRGIPDLPLSTIRAGRPAIGNPFNFGGASPLNRKQFHYAFANTLSREDSDAVWQEFAIPAPGNWVWAYGLIANFKPGKQETWVDFRNPDRAPLLFIAGGADHVMPPAVNKSNAKHYEQSEALTEYKEFPGRSHFTVGQDGWEEVADYALDWAVGHAAPAGAAARTAAADPS
jgi:pimeloyl-ACP methyl ester carboxylesterase